LAILSRLSQFLSPAVSTNLPFCVDNQASFGILQVFFVVINYYEMYYSLSLRRRSNLQAILFNVRVVVGLSCQSMMLTCCHYSLLVTALECKHTSIYWFFVPVGLLSLVSETHTCHFPSSLCGVSLLSLVAETHTCHFPSSLCGVSLLSLVSETHTCHCFSSLCGVSFLLFVTFLVPNYFIIP